MSDFSEHFSNHNNIKVSSETLTDLSKTIHQLEHLQLNL